MNRLTALAVFAAALTSYAASAAATFENGGKAHIILSWSPGRSISVFTTQVGADSVPLERRSELRENDVDVIRARAIVL